MPAATIPLTALRVANGKLALTLDDAGHDPRSIIMDLDDLERLVREMDRDIQTKIGGARHDPRTHVLLRRAAQEMLRQGDGVSIRAALLSVLWLALNHPHHADAMRAGLSEQIRRTGRAHLTAAVDARLTWSFTVAERWFDMHPMLEAVPADARLSVAMARTVPATSLN